MNSLSDTLLNRLVFAAVLMLSITGCKSDGDNGVGPDPDNGMNLIETAGKDSELSTLVELIIQAESLATLEGDGPLTLLAPVNSAFDSLPGGFLESLSQDQLAEILSYHIIPDNVDSDNLEEDEQAFATVQEDSVYITIDDSSSSNNIIWINLNSVVTGTDIEASNGRIHKIDDVLLPDAYLDVFEIMYKRYQTNKFACTCVSGRTGLRPVLKNTESEFTVFAPSDAAFESRSEDVDNLSDDELKNLMNYHIIPAKVVSGDLTDGQTLTARNNAELTISIAIDGTISINNGAAVVQTADLEGTNGLVYIIDTVLEPPADGN